MHWIVKYYLLKINFPVWACCSFSFCPRFLTSSLNGIVREGLHLHFICHVYICICIYIYFVFLGLHPWHMEVPRLGGESEQSPVYVTAMPDLSHICDLHHSSRQQWILNPLSEARDRTCVLMDTSWVHNRWATTGTPPCLLAAGPQSWEAALWPSALSKTPNKLNPQLVWCVLFFFLSSQ